MIMRSRAVLASLLWILLTASGAFSCSAEIRPHAATNVVAYADVILRVTAVEYYGVQPPRTERRLWNSNILFSVDEVVKGKYTKADLKLPGFLTDHDDWNHDPVPYNGPRPSAFGGQCFANGYRKG